MTAHLLALGSLFLLALATSAIPGPNNFLTLRTALTAGRGPALATAFGITAGCLIWCVAALLGLAALLAAAPWLHDALRVGGALYLFWIAVSLWRSGPAQPQADAAPAPNAWRAAFVEGALICLTNPKSVLFFASVFAAYVGPESPDWMRLAAAATVTATCLLWQGGLALALSVGPAVRAYARARRPLDRGAAALMGAFGASLLWSIR